MAELADALDLGSSGRPWGFKSLYPHQKIKKNGNTRSFYFAVRKELEPRFNPLAGDGNPFVLIVGQRKQGKTFPLTGESPFIRIKK